MKKLFVIVVAAVILGGLYFAYKHDPSPNKASDTMAGMNMAGMMMGGDASRRYTVSFATNPANPKPNQDTQLKFKIYDAASGNEVTDYSAVMTKLMHLVIVNSNLDYFEHIHPAQNGSEFTVTTSFPKADNYHLYINFQPNSATEQQIGFSLPVGVPASHTSSHIPLDSTLTKTFGNYKVTLSSASSQFNANDMNNMAEVLNFHIVDAKTGQPVSDLQPYLGAFGHLVMINEQTYKYVHIHPVASDNTMAGGPDVKFLPAALFDKIEPGIYRVFAQFQHNDMVFVADFTIKIN
ncbi:MAG: hypothetical protein ABI643_01860 [Candidatus Doudnabacteria bacterium]